VWRLRNTYSKKSLDEYEVNDMMNERIKVPRVVCVTMKIHWVQHALPCPLHCCWVSYRSVADNVLSACLGMVLRNIYSKKSLNDYKVIERLSSVCNRKCHVWLLVWQ
jgi:hypothetical protein